MKPTAIPACQALSMPVYVTTTLVPYGSSGMYVATVDVHVRIHPWSLLPLLVVDDEGLFQKH